eukprot:scaffold3342_cov174-Amphora_coffeaeformis.AAC.18
MATLLARPSHALVASASKRIAVIGGGASGIFASIAAATAAAAANENNDEAATQVMVFEATGKTLTKVKISGGGRCNVLHDTSKAIPDILAGYPRGRRELNGPYHKGFSPLQAQAWFERHGVTLKTEADGRMFPVTDSSQTVMDALGRAAQESGVHLKLRRKVNNIVANDDGKLHLSVTDKENGGASAEPVVHVFDSVILATGSAPLGYQLALQLGHTIESTVPSLFTLSAKEEIQPEGRFHELAGLSVPWARVTLKVPGQKKSKQTLQEEGPLLITHHGLSGPAALRLSAFGARVWHDLGYHGDVMVHWAPHLGTTDAIFEELWKMTSLRPKKTIASVCPLPGVDEGSSAIPRRLWASQCRAAGVEPDQVWGGVSKKIVRKLAMQVGECVVHVTGKGQFKEEFGTCDDGKEHLFPPCPGKRSQSHI